MRLVREPKRCGQASKSTQSPTVFNNVSQIFPRWLRWSLRWRPKRVISDPSNGFWTSESWNELPPFRISVFHWQNKELSSMTRYLCSNFTLWYCRGDGGGGGEWEEDGKSIRDRMEREAKKELQKTIQKQFEYRKATSERASDPNMREIPANCAVSNRYWSLCRRSTWKQRWRYWLSVPMNNLDKWAEMQRDPRGVQPDQTGLRAQITKGVMGQLLKIFGSELLSWSSPCFEVAKRISQLYICLMNSPNWSPWSNFKSRFNQSELC